eukprot:992872_1
MFAIFSKRHQTSLISVTRLKRGLSNRALDSQFMAANSVNRLGSEESPYLLQHAHNPVDWYPWGEEAFEAAKKNDRMIFLSIGYSTCHWCHVMEHESFEMDKTASVMNEHFISIKVDREERPDVDKVYMSFVQATTGGGGWPLSIFLTPDLKPVMGGTYFPPESKFGQPGFRDVLQRVASLWKSDRVGLEAQGSKIIEVLYDITSRSRVQYCKNEGGNMS